MKIRCLIVDDEPPARDELAFVLSKIDCVDVTGMADTPSRAIRMIRETLPDLVFLDIQMPGGTGFDVLADCLHLAKPPRIVFVTAFDRYAVRAFEENAVDYVLKPFAEERIRESIARVQRFHDDHENTARQAAILMETALSGLSGATCRTRIPVEAKGRIRFLLPEEIAFCTSEEGVVRIHTEEGILPAHGTPSLDSLEERLSGQDFFRCHRGYLVNLARIRECYPWFNSRYQIVMNDAAGTEIPVSKTRVRLFKDRLGI